jgi:hypothetical protein
MNISSRVPGISRNSGWRSIDSEIASRRALHMEGGRTYVITDDLSLSRSRLGNDGSLDHGGQPMNISSRVPGISRNSGWQSIDAEIASRSTASNGGRDVI